MSLPVLFDLRTRRTVELDRYEARAAFCAHRLAAIDPLDGDLIMIAWWSMRLDPESREQPIYIGPSIFFNPSEFTAPVLPVVGLSTSARLRLYVDAALVYKRSLAILEKALGPNHPAITDARNNLAEMYRKLGRSGERKV
jgi:Tetratricopeptide repeat